MGSQNSGTRFSDKQENECMKMIYYNFKRGIGRMAMLAMCLKLHGSLSETTTKAETNSVRV